MENILEIIPTILQGLGALVIVATAIVKITPSPKDDEQVSKLAKAFFRLLKFLPTIGINPQTKKIEDQYKEMQNK